MKPLSALSKTKFPWSYRKLFFDFCKSLLVLLVRKPFNWESFLQILYYSQKTFDSFNDSKNKGKNLVITLIFDISPPSFKLNRSIHWRCSIQKGVFINFVNFPGIRLSQSVITKTADKAQTSHRRVQTSHRLVQKSQRQLQTSHRRLETNHRRLQTSHRRLQTNFRQIKLRHRLLQAYSAVFRLFSR